MKRGSLCRRLCLGCLLCLCTFYIVGTVTDLWGTIVDAIEGPPLGESPDIIDPSVLFNEETEALDAAGAVTFESIDWSMYPRPPDDNAYAVVHTLPDGQQRVVANVSGVFIILLTGIHFSVGDPLPARIPQNLTEMMERYNGLDTVFSYPIATPEFPFVVLGEKPVALYFPHVVHDDECLAMITTASKHLERSLVAPTKDLDDSTVSTIRTSQQAWLRDVDDKVVDTISTRLQTIVGLQESEATQVLRYSWGQQYLAHHDYFDPLLYGAQSDNRAATFFLYLNTIPPNVRGDTYFPRAFGRPPADYPACDYGLSIHPRKGAGLLFYDQVPTGQLDAHSIHGSCAIEGRTVIKWGGTKWFHTDTSKYGASPTSHAFD